MAMLTVYCDDSGTDENTRVAVVAGYLSNDAQWELFNKEWTNVLTKFGITGMRRTDLENFRGEFKKWNPARRTALLQQLQPIIKHRTKMAVGTMAIKEEFEKFIPDDIKDNIGGMYGFLAYSCLIGVSQWCNRPSRQHKQPIKWVFESGTKGHGQVDKIFHATYANDKLRHTSHLGEWMFRRKDTIPLQSADLLAYECFKLIENQVLDKSEKHPVRISMAKLLGTEKYPYLRYFDKRGLEQFEKEWERRMKI